MNCKKDAKRKKESNKTFTNCCSPLKVGGVNLAFNLIISHIFPENFIKIPQVDETIPKFVWLILTIFINFSDFLAFSWYKETNDVSI